MKKLQENPSSALYPNPVMLVSSSHEGKDSIITLAWGGTCSSSPPTVGIAIRKNRFSYDLIANSKEFVVNIPTTEMIEEVELCGTKSGRDIDKWKESKFTKNESTVVKTPFIQECPVSMECELKQIVELGTHDLFLGEVVALHLDEEWKQDKYPNMLTYTRGVYSKSEKI
ncbi:MAG: flavin reductase family protein [Candidatus Heimdallarchaeota archaeon]|nr:flavin reductase family protein [Candidatus Heimdallarchaeota archaeon]MCK4878154.1 flavin reductase family protein [Candidatus Heimdallarchaeota archaeon]